MWSRVLRVRERLVRLLSGNAVFQALQSHVAMGTAAACIKHREAVEAMVERGPVLELAPDSQRCSDLYLAKGLEVVACDIPAPASGLPFADGQFGTVVYQGLVNRLPPDDMAR